MKIGLNIVTSVENLPANLKASWDEVTYEEFLKLAANAKVEESIQRIILNISVLTGLSAEDIGQFGTDSINSLLPFLEFIDDVESLMALSIPKDIHDINIGTESWGKLESAKQLMSQAGESFMPIIPALLDVYHPIKDFKQLVMTQAMPIALAMINKLNEFFSRYQRLNDYKPDSDELAAGLDKLNQYGFFSTLHALADGNPLLYDDMLNQPADVIYQTLVMDFEIAEYNKRLRKNQDKKK
jgi:hypothetical protein